MKTGEKVLAELVGDRIVSDLTAATKKEVLLALAGRIGADHPELRTEEIFLILQEREDLGSTGIGEGVAIPHGKLKELQQVIVCFGRSKAGIQFEAVDGQPVHLFFVLLAPQSAAREYLSTLAHLSRFLKNPAFRSRLANADSDEELRAIFRDTAWD